MPVPAAWLSDWMHTAEQIPHLLASLLGTPREAFFSTVACTPRRVGQVRGTHVAVGDRIAGGDCWLLVSPIELSSSWVSAPFWPQRLLSICPEFLQ